MAKEQDKKKMKVKDLIMARMPKRVRLTNPVSSGGSIFNIDDLSANREYEVWGMHKERFSDGGTELCYLVQDEKGVLVSKSVEKFKVID